MVRVVAQQRKSNTTSNLLLTYEPTTIRGIIDFYASTALRICEIMLLLACNNNLPAYNLRGYNFRNLVFKSTGGFFFY